MTLSRITLITSLLMLTASTAFAGIVRVGPKRFYKTIQDGVNSASAGDKILIDKGVYVEGVTVATADLTIQPAKKGKKGKVTIDGGGSDIPLTVTTSGVVVKDLRVSNAPAAGAGIAFGGGAFGIKIIRCVVMGGAEDYGIFTNFAPNCLISKCKVLNANVLGIYVGPGSMGSVVTKCKVIDATWEGLLIASDSVTVTDNKVIRSGDEGIVMGDSANMFVCNGSLVSGNEVRHAGDDSVYIGGYASHCVFENNVIRESNSLGFATIGTSNHLFAGNTVVSSKIDSFYLWDSSWTKLYKNVVKDCQTDSYETAFNCTNIDLVENTSRRAGDSGFAIHGSNHTLMHNDSRKSNRLSGFGLDFETAGATSLLYMGNSYDTSDF